MPKIVDNSFPIELFKSACFDEYESKVIDELPSISIPSGRALHDIDISWISKEVRKLHKQYRSGDQFGIYWDISYTQSLDYGDVIQWGREAGERAFSEEKRRIRLGALEKYRQFNPHVEVVNYISGINVVALSDNTSTYLGV